MWFSCNKIDCLLLPFTAQMSIVRWVTHDSGISLFWFALYKLHNFFVNMSFVYAIGVCNKMVLTIDLQNTYRQVVLFASVIYYNRSIATTCQILSSWQP